MASRSSHLGPGRLRNFLRRQVLEGDTTRPEPQLLGIVGRLQVLGKEADDMWIEMNIGVQLEALQPEGVGWIGSVAPIVVQDILIYAAEFAA